MKREPTPDALGQEVAASLAALPSLVLTLTALPIRIQIRSGSVWVINTLESLFQPYVSGIMNSPSSRDAVESVHVLVDPDLADRLANSMPMRENARASGLSGWSLAATGVHLVEKQAGVGLARSTCHLGWLEADPSATLLVLRDARPASSRLLLRSVRAIASRMLLQAGWVPLHAAGAALPAGGILLIGRRGGGKTTAMLGMLSAGAGFLANDQVFVAAQGPVPDSAGSARGLPTAVSIRQPTIGLFPPLAAFAQKAAELHCENVTDGPLSLDRRLLIPSACLAAAFRVPVIASATPRAVVAVDYRGNDGPSQWRMVPVPNALAWLRSHYLDPWFPDDGYEMQRLREDHEQLRNDHQQRLTALAAQLPMALFQPGRDAKAILQQVIGNLLD